MVDQPYTGTGTHHLPSNDTDGTLKIRASLSVLVLQSHNDRSEEVDVVVVEDVIGGQAVVFVCT